jgi:hypothetical protein
MNINLDHWGESDFNDWISEPRFSGKRLYFFGELELTLDWFRAQVEKQLDCTPIIGQKGLGESGGVSRYSPD